MVPLRIGDRSGVLYCNSVKGIDANILSANPLTNNNRVKIPRCPSLLLTSHAQNNARLFIVYSLNAGLLITFLKRNTKQ